MAPRGKKNPYYRTNEQLADDVFHILQSESLSIGAKHAVVFEVTWLWTEAEGKYTGCKFWSKQALEHIDKPQGVKSKILRHDHVVPRNYIVKRLLFGELMSRQEVYKFLNDNLIGCIVTKEEDDLLNENGYQREMPKGWSFGGDVWARYKATDIEIHQISWNKKIGSTSGE
ncbi:hypothetical protein [Cohnella cholangitidis]|uniref:Uncharacterized protein n=1 Tax=Cohnella cholangitidis TaxID=2598458 RepID=A0A7G5C4X9_9BACL|nr:hypothetical protein [Cohnella cholangitidis]QMV44263.1 hypothetical protein FPL14_26170 [Cohnella cholangitidis]